jgi:hypothetical protein
MVLVSALFLLIRSLIVSRTALCVVAELRAVDARSSHQFEEEIGAASSENGFFAKIEFSVRTTL